MKMGARSDGQVIARCPFCGDSDNPNSGHLSVNLRKGLYYCFRCKAHGKLPASVLVQLLNDQPFSEADLVVPQENPDEIYPPYYFGPGSQRESLLDRYHKTWEGDLWDVFESRHPETGGVSGIVMRNGKKSRNFGHVYAGWVGQDLVSTAKDPLVIVEGPYDVLDERDVSVFGLIHAKRMKTFRGHWVVLRPDGDIFIKPDLQLHFSQLITMMLRTTWTSPILVGIDIIPDGLDPDEITDEEQIIRVRDYAGMLTVAKTLQNMSDNS